MSVPSLILLLIPLVYLTGVLLPNRRFVPAGRRAPAAPLVAGIALLLTVSAGALLVASAPTVSVVAIGGAPLAIGPVVLSLRLDAVTVVMLLLVNSIGLVILRFSRRYLDGETKQPRYFRFFLATLAAVSLLIITNNLAVLALAWTASSFTLHRLLEFYEERTPALIAAHKKFLMARMADISIFAAFALLWKSQGTLEIDTLLARAAEWRDVPEIVKAAGVLLACGVVVRSAQLPFHGWLIQVMEAPTPVSALLHAGVVNIGGFVMIRLAGLMGHIDAAQLLLVIVGTITATLAGLVMMTRVSVKVALAWSTCAQMGFMLLECGLGAYSLAMLHLVAHSLYKAHAFLSSGRTVDVHVRRTMRAPAPWSVSGWMIGGGAALLLLAAAIAAFDISAIGKPSPISAIGEPSLLVMALVLALALAPVLARALIARDRSSLPLVGAALALATLYAAAHWAAGHLVAPVASTSSTTVLISSAIVAIAFTTLFFVQGSVLAAPRGRIARALYPACFAGFYLDEIFTKLTFRIWPPAPAVPRTRRERSHDVVLKEVTV